MSLEQAPIEGAYGVLCLLAIGDGDVGDAATAGVTVIAEDPGRVHPRHGLEGLPHQGLRGVLG